MEFIDLENKQSRGNDIVESEVGQVLTELTVFTATKQIDLLIA